MTDELKAEAARTAGLLAFDAVAISLGEAFLLTEADMIFLGDQLKTQKQT